MMKGIDCTARIDFAKAKELKAAGYDFVCRYLVPEKFAWKRLIKDEAIAMTDAGLQILSVFETTANAANRGSAGGRNDGAAAYIEARIAGQPEGSAIYFAVDYDAQPSDYDAIAEYLKAAQKVLLGYNVGVYGSYAVCEEMYKRGIKYLWQTYAWSRGNKAPHRNVYQYKNGVKVCGIDCDLNESYGNEGMWNMAAKYSKQGLTHVIELDPMMAKAARGFTTGAGFTQKFKNFVNGNFFYHSTIIGWLISEGRIISRRDEYKTWKGNPKGTLMVLKDGTVRCGLMLDSEVAPLADAGKVWFCCQGFNLFPCNIAREGFTDSSIARTCNRIAVGYNAKNNKIYITARPLSNWARAVKTMTNLGCGAGICLDSGASANMYVNGKALMKTNAVLTNIVYWN